MPESVIPSPGGTGAVDPPGDLAAWREQGADLDGRTRASAGAVALAAAGSAVSLAIFFAGASPFGAINDLGNALIGALCAVLAWVMRDVVRGTVARVAIPVAMVGAAISAVGSALVLSASTGYLLAGLVSGLGFACIGLWVAAISRSMDRDRRWPRRLVQLGYATGAVLALGFIGAPGVLMGIDDLAAGPGWVWIGFGGWLGTYVLLPAWATMLSRSAPAPQARSD